MNNDQFRKLLLSDTPRNPSSTPRDAPSATPSLGTRQRSFVPMTPRAVSLKHDFASEARALKTGGNSKGGRPSKKFRTSAPLGVKLGAGYVDRAKARETPTTAEDEEIAEREKRLEQLREAAQRGEVDYDVLVEQSRALGGDVKSTHLVRGLDFRLLEKVKKGEDVMGSIVGEKKEEGKKAEEEDEEEEEDNGEELDEELDAALGKEVAPLEKVVAKKKTREEMLAELKEMREKAKQEAAGLGSKFKTIGGKQEPQKAEKPKYKTVIGKDGKVKKLKRKEKKEEDIKPKGEVLGMMPPPPKPSQVQKVEDDDFDIFEGVGTDYDPLAGIRDDDDDSSDDEKDKEKKEQKEEGEVKEASKPAADAAAAAADTASMPPPPKPKINYFNDETEKEEESMPKSTADLLAANPDLAMALKKAAHIAEKQEKQKSEEEMAKEKRIREMLEAGDRDMMDMDMGFGGSTDYGDDDEEDGPITAGPGKKRKRGNKKPNAKKDDVESVMKFAKR
ncbi:hypothetical protein BJ508DRAFT_322729 [Ascobolus immersus RN42]|uniref:RED-like N-terminal domain-containing protein n=1 Tax=Ascobolus immersus RN42 TaxID=1160509 RepID=A0A3N4II35_ASCIM|nr:hypothetical protein BJ508DRAFT_322729 [Ascobolus immersus RN42]